MNLYDRAIERAVALPVAFNMSLLIFYPVQVNMLSLQESFVPFRLYTQIGLVKYPLLNHG